MLYKTGSLSTKQLLPELDQVEQKELRKQQIIQKYGFIIDSVSSGLSDAIVGAIEGDRNCRASLLHAAV